MLFCKKEGADPYALPDLSLAVVKLMVPASTFFARPRSGMPVQFRTGGSRLQTPIRPPRTGGFADTVRRRLIKSFLDKSHTPINGSSNWIDREQLHAQDIWTPPAKCKRTMAAHRGRPAMQHRIVKLSPRGHRGSPKGVFVARDNLPPKDFNPRRGCDVATSFSEIDAHLSLARLTSTSVDTKAHTR